MLNFSLTDLRYLLALAEEKHFARAAQKCFVSQPTLSIAIKKLEENLGITIFERDNHQILVSPSGAQLIEQAKIKKALYDKEYTKNKKEKIKKMKYTLVNETATNAMRLQSIGNVLGTPAMEIKKGDSLMWNFGAVEVVNDILKETDKMLTISILYNGNLYERKLAKKRLVCILK